MARRIFAPTDIDPPEEAEPVGYHYKRSGGNAESVRRIAEALVIAALITLGGSVWLLRESVTVLQVTQKMSMDYTREKFAEVKERQDRFEGKWFRGLDALDEADNASKRKP